MNLIAGLITPLLRSTVSVLLMVDALVVGCLLTVSTVSAQHTSQKNHQLHTGQKTQQTDLGSLLPDPGQPVRNNKNVTLDNFSRIDFHFHNSRFEVEEFLGAGFVTLDTLVNLRSFGTVVREFNKVVVQYKGRNGKVGIEVTYLNDTVFNKSSWGFDQIAERGKSKGKKRQAKVINIVKEPSEVSSILPGEGTGFQPDMNTDTTAVRSRVVLRSESSAHKSETPVAPVFLNNDSVTIENYHRITMGDSRHTVESYLGTGTTTSSFTEGGSVTRTVEYRRDHGKQGIEITYTDDAVMGKSSWGLE